VERRTARGHFRIGAAGLACLLAASVPAMAASSVTIGGTVLTVWEQAAPPAVEGAVSPGLEIVYSVSDATGIRFGTIAPTGDAALDSSPFLAVDPSSRIPVAVWSRFDGVTWKIAYARFEYGDWTDVHYLTFGRKNDTLPRLGVSLTGAYLFWVSDARYTYAPIDLSKGRLFAAPKAITVGDLRRSQGTSLRLDDALTVDGSSDVPVVVGKGKGDVSDPILHLAGGETVQGSSDVPVVIPTKASLWGVGSRDDCRHLVLVIPHRSLRSAFVVRFADGALELLREIAIPSPIPETFAEAAASLEADADCR
jgi:hypothetical protein